MWSDDNRSGAFDLARQRLAEADAKRSAELDAQIARQKGVDDRGERRCADCHQMLRRTQAGDLCDRCYNRRWMRENRRKVPLTGARLHEERRKRRVAAARRRLVAKGINL